MNGFLDTEDMSSAKAPLKPSRRQFVGIGGVSAVSVLLGTGAITTNTAVAQPTLPDNPFKLGVASGDPRPDSVVLWTRLAPEPLAEDGHGGMHLVPIEVRYEVSADERFRRVARRGSVVATPELAHSVHAEVFGLEPGREYFYRFRVGREVSPTGRTKTSPLPTASPSSFSFAFASCQDWQTGYYTAYRHLVEEDLDLVIHLGDYIYEAGSYGPSYPRPQPGPGTQRDVIRALYEYRNRHAQYKTDEDLQAAHAAFPWVAVLDDHDVRDNFADAHHWELPPDLFREQRTSAFRAYYEHLPLRHTSIPRGPDMRLYRRLRHGSLVEFNVLDTRQYRDDQACGDGRQIDCDARLDPDRSILGPTQERWLLDGLTASDTTWNVLAQQVFFSRWAFDGNAELRSMDAWDGYEPSRERILSGLTQRSVSNPVVISGDIHVNVAADIKANFDDPDSETIGSEFAGTAISSVGDGTDFPAWAARDLETNPHFKFINSQRGYVRCSVSPQQWRADYRVVPYVSEPGAPITTRSSFTIENGRPGMEKT